MSFILIVCPACHQIHVLEDKGQKTTSCQRCNKRHKLAKLRILKHSQVLQELITHKGVLAAKMAGRSEGEINDLMESMSLETERECQRGLHRGGSEKEVVLAAVEELGSKFGEEGFTQGDLFLAIRARREDVSGKKWLKVLQEEGIIYRGQDGKFRAV